MVSATKNPPIVPKDNKWVIASRRQSIESADIGAIPPVVNPQRKAWCERDLLLFLQWYFPETTGQGTFSAAHIAFIDDLQEAILREGRIARAVFRGFAKTTIGELSVLWALLYGHRKFIPLVGADAEASKNNLSSIKIELTNNEILAEDFPEVCYPFQRLENKWQRTHTQTSMGRLTKTAWTSDRVVFPDLEGAAGAGACVLCTSLLTFNRGQKHKFSDGSDCRPDFVFIDDPQTDASAASDLQVQTRENKLNATILKSAGHSKNLSIFVAGTIIRRGCMMDRLTDPEVNPSWRAERVPMVESWSKAHDTLWLKDYRAIRFDFDRKLLGDQARARQRATDFYIKNREAMDDGASVTWDKCYNESVGEVSALQHAYNWLIDDGEEVFASECQNAPKAARSDIDMPSAEDIAVKVGHTPRGIVPADTQWLVAAVDVQGAALYWTAIAVNDTFAIHVVDYGVWPEQDTNNARLAQIKKTLAKRYNSKDQGSVILLGLRELFDKELAPGWHTERGGEMRLNAACVDCNWSESTASVMSFCSSAKLGFPVIPSSGKSITAANKPMAEWHKKPGDRIGDCWRYKRREGTMMATLDFDSNAWKTRLARALSMPVGGEGALTLFAGPRSTHRGIAEQLTSEVPRQTEGGGRIVYQWFLRPHVDNHWFDCLAGGMALASMAGADRPGATRQPRSRARVRYVQ